MINPLFVPEYPGPEPWDRDEEIPRGIHWRPEAVDAWRRHTEPDTVLSYLRWAERRVDPGDRELAGSGRADAGTG